MDHKQHVLIKIARWMSSLPYSISVREVSTRVSATYPIIYKSHLHCNIQPVIRSYVPFAISSFTWIWNSQSETESIRVYGFFRFPHHTWALYALSTFRLIFCPWICVFVCRLYSFVVQSLCSDFLYRSDWCWFMQPKCIGNIKTEY